jgi:two-component system response regulator
MSSTINTEILLVEDDLNDAEVARRAFQRSGMEDRLAIVRDGQAALEYVYGSAEAGDEDSRPVPRVIFLDLRLPGLSGWDLLRRFRSHARTKEVPVVVVSSSNREGDVRESYRMGANSFLVKRYERERPGEYLVDAARYWLELNRGPE